MVSFWKQRRQVDKDYLKLIREKPCCVCFGVAEPRLVVLVGATTTRCLFAGSIIRSFIGWGCWRSRGGIG